jgi:hypothetical protein
MAFPPLVSFEYYTKATHSLLSVCIKCINDILNHGFCTNFEDGQDSNIASATQNKWLAVFVPVIQTRLNNDFKGANYTLQDVISFKDLCSFNSVASPTSIKSPFSALSTKIEWYSHDYYEPLGKYYGYGPGDLLGPT